MLKSILLVSLVVTSLCVVSYSGGMRQAFAGDGIDLSGAGFEVEPIKDQIANYYTGATPEVVVTDGTVTLKKDVDYTVKYIDNWCVSYNPEEDSYVKFVKTAEEPGDGDGWKRVETLVAKADGRGTPAQGFHSPYVEVTGINDYEGTITKDFEIVLRYAPGLNYALYDDGFMNRPNPFVVATAEDKGTESPYWNHDANNTLAYKTYAVGLTGGDVFNSIVDGTLETDAKFTNIKYTEVNARTGARIAFYTGNITPDKLLCGFNVPSTAAPDAFTLKQDEDYPQGWSAYCIEDDPGMVMTDAEGDSIEIKAQNYKTTLQDWIPVKKQGDDGNTEDIDLDWKKLRLCKMEFGNLETDLSAYSNCEGYFYRFVYPSGGPDETFSAIITKRVSDTRAEVVFPTNWYPLYSGAPITPDYIVRTASPISNALNSGPFPKEIDTETAGDIRVIKQGDGENEYKVSFPKAGYMDDTYTFAYAQGNNRIVSDAGASNNAKRTRVLFSFSGPHLIGATANVMAGFTVTKRPIDNDISIYTSTPTAVYDDLGMMIAYGIDEEYEYVGEPITPEPKLTMVKPSDETFMEYTLPETDYMVDPDDPYGDNNELGTDKGRVTIVPQLRTYTANVTYGTTTRYDPETGIGGNLTGSVDVLFDIVPAKTMKVSAPAQATLVNGEAKPAITVTNVNDTILTEGKDYTVAYSNNTSAGTATVTVTGIGAIYGAAPASGSATFTVKAAGPGPSPDPDPKDPIDEPAERLFGDDRYQTMKSIVLKGWQQSDIVIVASGENFPDALAASGLAGIKDAPVVLTNKGTLTKEAKETIEALKPKTIFIIGGPAAVDSAVEASLKTIANTVERIYGDDRYETAIDVYRAGGKVWGSTAVIASGNNFPDALSISPYAFDTNSPIFLADRDNGLDQATINTIKGGNFTNVVIVGGPAAVPDSVISQLGLKSGQYVRLSGDHRYATSAEIVKYTIANSSLTYANLVCATGFNYPDALAGGAYSGKVGSVLLLIHETADGGLYGVDNVIKPNAKAIGKVQFLGGTAVISDDLAKLVESATKG